MLCCIELFDLGRQLIVVKLKKEKEKVLSFNFLCLANVLIDCLLCHFEAKYSQDQMGIKFAEWNGWKVQKDWKFAESNLFLKRTYEKESW